MTPAPERVDKRLQDLIEIIQFTEGLSVKIHGLLDEGEILRTVVQESLRAGKYAISIFLLDDDGRHLRVMDVPSFPAAADLEAGAQASGAHPFSQFAMDVDRSILWRPVIRRGRTVQHTVEDVVRASFPPPAAELTLEATGQGRLSCILTPLWRQDKVVGALSFAFGTLGRYLQPSVLNLAQHITHALEAAQADALRAQAEALLRQDEAILRALFDATSEILFVMDPQGTILAANKALAARFDTSVEQLIGSNAYDLLPPEVGAARKVRIAELLRSGQPVAFEDQRDGRVLEHHNYPICDSQGEVVSIAVLAADITELRQLNEALQQSEERFRQMADVMPAAFWMVAPDWKRMIFMSTAFETIYGFSREACYTQPSRWIDAIHPDDRATVLAFWKEHHGQAAECQYRIVRPDGDVRWVRDVSSPVRSEAGELLVVVGFVEDITERVYAEGQVRRAEKLSSLGLLAAGIAHGLRNPLGVISACAQMLLEYPDDRPLQIECAQKIDAATQRSSQIVENLLRFARPQDVPMTAVDVPAVLQDVLVLLADHMALHHVTLGLKLEPGLPAIRGNAQSLQQFCVDIVLNACRAMSGGGTLTVSATEPEPGWVEIRFQDTGCGIAREHLARVFDPFFTTAPDGVGLGLFVSHNIIQQHGGTIQVESELGQGTTFTIRLSAAGGR
jgi:PAS domain S-box-containing protein